MQTRFFDVAPMGRGPLMGLVGLLALAAASCGDTVSLPSELDDGGDEPRYESILLDALGGSESNGWTINGAGVVAGWSNVADGRAVRWAGNEAVDLIGSRSGARGINDAGAVAGYHIVGQGYQAYVLHDGVRTDLEPLEPDDQDIWTFAHGINQGGTVVGVSSGRVVVWRPATGGGYQLPVSLELHLRGDDRAQLNARGDVAFTSYGNGWPVVWIAQPDGGYGEPLWLGRPGEGAYTVRGINDAGVIVGSRSAGGATMAVAWLPDRYDRPIEFGVGEAWDINETGQIVGTTGGDLPLFGGAPRRPALWTLEASGAITAPQDLGTPSDYGSGGARAISDHGWIVGSSWGPSREVAATLWKPRS